MKEIYKKPIFYYVLVPIVIGLWPVWLFSVGIPGAEKNLDKEIKDYTEARKLMSEILSLDPQRLDYASSKKTGEDFDYTTAVDQVTRLCRILPTSYRLSSSPIRRIKGGQKNQDASMTIDRIDIEKFSKFLSTMHMRWSNLQCTNATLTKIKGEKDAWKADIRFMYYE
ncbi:MAG: hypothetical protein PHQ00_00280 [Phycisphaerae bacterium]|nr:hypothetical protein [Phycisphaerae bacterium]